MKKNLTKVLARLARDGDAETVAEFIGEMIGETPEEPAPEAAPDAGAESAETVTVEVPEGREITVDCESFSALLEKMDRLIELLAGALAAPPVPGTDGDGEAGEIAEAVEEAVEAAQQEGEVPAEEIADLVETILEGERGSFSFHGQNIPFLGSFPGAFRHLLSTQNGNDELGRTVFIDFKRVIHTGGSEQSDHSGCFFCFCFH